MGPSLSLEGEQGLTALVGNRFLAGPQSHLPQGSQLLFPAPVILAEVSGRQATEELCEGHWGRAGELSIQQDRCGSHTHNSPTARSRQVPVVFESVSLSAKQGL